jgi:DNA-binding CsgD family transcriptional regulator
MELLEAYHEPAFSERSHGFREGRGGNTQQRTRSASARTSPAWPAAPRWPGHVASAETCPARRKDARTAARRSAAAAGPLSDGEIRLLRYLPTNLSAREIANELYVSTNTVKTHMQHLYAKLGLRRVNSGREAQYW